MSDPASEMVTLLYELGIAQADFLGFSLCGLTALEIAVWHPERVGRLALAATMYTQDGVHGEVHVPDYSSPRLPAPSTSRTSSPRSRRPRTHRWPSCPPPRTWPSCSRRP
jgi:pimeloyl-ACP methyl ester carboxylesterase